MRRLLTTFAVLALLGSPSWAQESGPTGDNEFVVYFDLNSASLDAAALQTIEAAATDFRETGSTRITVGGHTDTSGSADYNLRLSQRRADAVAAELTRMGVPAEAIAVDAFGQTDLAVATGDGVRERANRRVEIAVEQPAAEPAPVTAAAEPEQPMAEVMKRGLFSLGGFHGYNMLDQGDNEGEESKDNNDKSSHLAGANLSFDYAMLSWLSLGLEQALFYNLGTDDDGLGGRSAAGLDFLLGSGNLIPYVGGNVGYIYGSGIEDDGFAGPEVGLNIGPLNAKVAYDMPFDRGADEGIIAATIGLGIKF